MKLFIIIYNVNLFCFCYNQYNECAFLKKKIIFKIIRIIYKIIEIIYKIIKIIYKINEIINKIILKRQRCKRVLNEKRIQEIESGIKSFE